jgi:hypothetical protein
MAGLAMFTHKTTGALAQSPGAPARSHVNFQIALKLFTKTFPLYKNLVKSTKT